MKAVTKELTIEEMRAIVKENNKRIGRIIKAQELTKDSKLSFHSN